VQNPYLFFTFSSNSTLIRVIILTLSIDKNVNIVLRLELRIMIRKYSTQGDSWEVTSSLVLFFQYKKHQIKGEKFS